MSATNNLPSYPFTKGEIITSPFSKGRLGGIFLLTNPKGISVLFLVIAMMLMVTIGYVFSYLIPTKQKSVSFTIQSTQALFIAQSGVEYAVRYATVQGWVTPNALLGLNGAAVYQRNLGGGRFTISYTNTNNTLTSVGEVPSGTERRRITVSNFTSFLTTPTGLILDPLSPSPCGANGTTTVRFYIRNASENSIILDYFSARWGGGRRLRSLSMNGILNWTGNSTSAITRAQFNQTNPPTHTYTIASNGVVYVDLTWNNNLTGTNITITFFTGATGNGYIFYLDPAGGGLRGCP